MVTTINTKSSDTPTDTASDEDSESRKSKTGGNSLQKGKMNKFAVRMARHMHMTTGNSVDKSHHSDAKQSSMDETSSSHSHVSSQHAAHHQ